MGNFLYDPSCVGKSIFSKHNKLMIVRKYHLTDVEIENCIEKHIINTRNVPDSIKRLASSYFFNPYRKGIYWCQLQSLYLLGCNKWHNLKIIIDKTKELMEEYEYLDKKTNIKYTLWEKFKNRYPKNHIFKSKSHIGRIQENFIFMQRLGCNHPSGYKLRQAYAALDLKRVSCRGFVSGLYYYRLSTYSTDIYAYPIRDFSEFNFDDMDYRCFKKGFLGIIITDKEVLDFRK